MHRLNEQLTRLSTTDALTEVGNRRMFDQTLKTEWARASRRGEPLGLLMIDIDHFKEYNDHYGHPAGDECLKQVSAALAQSCKRTTDLVARYGGEEFALLLPATPPEGALKVIEAARAELGRLAIPHAASQTAGVVTFSAGLASFVHGRDSDPRELVKRADEALYRAKELGRNRTISAA